MPTTAEIIDLPAQREWRRIQVAVMAVNQRTELAHMGWPVGVIDQAKHIAKSRTSSKSWRS